MLGECSWELVYSIKMGLEDAQVLVFPRSPVGCRPRQPRTSSRVSGHILMSTLTHMSWGLLGNFNSPTTELCPSTFLAEKPQALLVEKIKRGLDLCFGNASCSSPFTTVISEMEWASW